MPTIDVKARLFLYAILPLLEELARLDPEAKQTISKLNGGIYIAAPPGLAVTILLQNGAVTVLPDERRKTNVSLIFPHHRFVCNLFERRGIPLMFPTSGAWRLNLLLGLKRLADRLSVCLENDQPSSSEEIALQTTLLLHAALRGAAQVGEADHDSRAIVRGMPNGTAHFTVNDGPSAYLSKRGNSFVVRSGTPETANVTLRFRDVRVAHAMLTGRLDNMAAIGLGDVQIGGSIPLADRLTQLMERADSYLKPTKGAP